MRTDPPDSAGEWSVADMGGCQRVEEAGLLAAAVKRVWIDASAEALTDAGLDEDTARARAQRAVMMIQGSLVLSRGMGTTKPFRDALAALADELLGAVG
jgi:TetR/AcrR family transcriptional repressor of lmrAB and yxaGH operons